MKSSLHEIADVFIPALFLKPYPRLPIPKSFDECTFTRFIIIGYIFCAQPMTDVIHEFFAITKQNFNMKLSTTFFTFNLKEFMKVNTEEMKKTAALKYVLERINPKDDTELRLETIILLGIKYPVIFYPLQRFRKKFRRVIFGDKFWGNKKTMRTKFRDAFGMFKGKSSGYEDEESASRETARSIIGDCFNIAEVYKRFVCVFLNLHFINYSRLVLCYLFYWNIYKMHPKL